MKAIYPGTFDPITNGHVDLIDRSLKIFDEVLVAIARNAPKAPLFPAEDRLTMALDSLGGKPNLSVEIFDSLLIDYARDRGARVILRGLRAVSDFEYELMIALTNRKLNPDIETMFMAPSKKFIYLSSSMVKEIARYGGPIEEFVPAPVVKHLRIKFPAA